MLQQADVRALLGSRRPDHSLPRAFYVDPGVFQVDMEQIWYRSWLFSILSCEIPRRGDWVVHNVGQYSVIVVRGDDGEIRAFHNTCCHRGSVVCKGVKGRRPKLVCPYHQWTYGLDGKLVFARDMAEDPGFDLSQHGLKSVHCRENVGLVYTASPTSRRRSRSSLPKRENTSRRTTSPTRRSRTRARSSRRATGSSCGRTTASATTAPPTIPRCAAPSPRTRG